MDSEPWSDPDFIEHGMGYPVLDPNGRAYNRTVHCTWPSGGAMTQQWSDHLDGLKAGKTAAG